MKENSSYEAEQLPTRRGSQLVVPINGCGRTVPLIVLLGLLLLVGMQHQADGVMLIMSPGESKTTMLTTTLYDPSTGMPTSVDFSVDWAYGGLVGSEHIWTFSLENLTSSASSNYAVSALYVRTDLSSAVTSYISGGAVGAHWAFLFSSMIIGNANSGWSIRTAGLNVGLNTLTLELHTSQNFGALGDTGSLVFATNAGNAVFNQQYVPTVVTTVPEPSSALLLGGGALAALLRRHRRGDTVEQADAVKPSLRVT